MGGQALPMRDPSTPDAPPPEPDAPTRLVLVEPPRAPRGRVGRLLIPLAKLGAFLALTGLTAAVGLAVVLYYRFSQGLPDIPKVSAYAPPVLTEVFTDDQVLAGEFYDERRKVVPYERIPKRLVQAFIASEDAAFFDHYGLDPVGTARAAFKTILHKTSGQGGVQGGSTLTQQTAKALLVSAEGFEKGTRRKGQEGLVRKIREAILARRLEATLTKEEILYLYLNNVYLGHHAYGVQAAAENYFRRDVRDLSLAEMALIAGLPQAPSRYSPFMNPKAATERRGYVLRRMREEGMISREEHDAAAREQIHVYPVEDVFHEFAPYFVEQVRKDVFNRYGNPALLRGGLEGLHHHGLRAAAGGAGRDAERPVGSRQAPGLSGPLAEPRHPRAAACLPRARHRRPRRCPAAGGDLLRGVGDGRECRRNRSHRPGGSPPGAAAAVGPALGAQGEPRGLLPGRHAELPQEGPQARGRGGGPRGEEARPLRRQGTVRQEAG